MMSYPGSGTPAPNSQPETNSRFRTLMDPAHHNDRGNASHVKNLLGKASQPVVTNPPYMQSSVSGASSTAMVPTMHRPAPAYQPQPTQAPPPPSSMGVMGQPNTMGPGPTMPPYSNSQYSPMQSQYPMPQQPTNGFLGSSYLTNQPMSSGYPNSSFQSSSLYPGLQPQPSVYQGSNYQGSNYQGSGYQGSLYPQSSSYLHSSSQPQATPWSFLSSPQTRSKSRNRHRHHHSRKRYPENEWDHLIHGTQPKSRTRSKSSSSSDSSSYYESDSDSDSDSSTASFRKEKEQRKAFKIMQKVMPPEMLDVMREALRKQAAGQGIRLPKGHESKSMATTQFLLLQDMVEKERKSKQLKVKMGLQESAKLIDWGCKLFRVDPDVFDGSKVPSAMREALKEGHFNEVMGGLAEEIEGTWFDHPLVGAALCYSNVLSAANKDAQLVTADKLEDKMEAEREQKRQEMEKLMEFRTRASQIISNRSNMSQSSVDTKTSEVKPAESEPKRNKFDPRGSQPREPARTSKPASVDSSAVGASSLSGPSGASDSASSTVTSTYQPSKPYIVNDVKLPEPVKKSKKVSKPKLTKSKQEPLSMVMQQTYDEPPVPKSEDVTQMNPYASSSTNVAPAKRMNKINPSSSSASGATSQNSFSWTSSQPFTFTIPEEKEDDIDKDTDKDTDKDSDKQHSDDDIDTSHRKPKGFQSSANTSSDTSLSSLLAS